MSLFSRIRAKKFQNPLSKIIWLRQLYIILSYILKKIDVSDELNDGKKQTDIDRDRLRCKECLKYVDKDKWNKYKHR